MDSRSDRRQDRRPDRQAADILNRPLPSDFEAEIAVIGSVLLSPKIIEFLHDILPSGHFFDDSARKVYQAMLQVYADKGSVDVVTLSSYLKDHGFYEAIGGAAFMAQCINSVPNANSARNYTAIINEMNSRRELYRIGSEMVQDVFDNSPARKDAKQISVEVEGRVAMVGVADRSEIIHLSDAANQYIDQVEKNSKAKHSIGVPTGVYSIDEATGGLFPGELCVVAARPSIGKTSLGMQILRYAAFRNRPALMVSIEMKASEVAGRIVAAESDLEGQDMRRGNINDEQIAYLRRVAEEFREVPLDIWRPRSPTIEQIRAKARLLAATSGLQIMAIDYLTKIRGSDVREPRHEQITHIMQETSALCEELDIPIIMLAQAKRSVAGQKRPTYSDLYGSSMIEAEADSVWMLHRPTTSSREAEIFFDKNRHGTGGSMKLLYDASRTQFVDASPGDF